MPPSNYQISRIGSHEYLTFKQEEEKMLRVVLRDIPQILSLDEIKQNLKDVGFEANSQIAQKDHWN